MTDPVKKCCFSGHRPEKMPFYDNRNSYDFLIFKKALEHAIQDAINSGYRYFITGMARGMDLWSAQTVIAFRRAYGDIKLEAAIPYEGLEKDWSRADRLAFNEVRSMCDSEIVFAPQYMQGLMHQRNRYMVDASGVLIAAYNGSPGGTRSTLLYALRQGLEIIELPVEE